MTTIETIQSEFTTEAAQTRNMLELVPEDRFEWQPHETSMTLVRLVQHIADIPQWTGVVLGQDEIDLGGEFPEPSMPTDRAELLELFDRNCDVFNQNLADCTDEHLAESWKLRRGDEVLVDLPRMAALRSFILNHIVHHRGQLSVYLRLLEVPLPRVYGPTADAPDMGG